MSECDIETSAVRRLMPTVESGSRKLSYAFKELETRGEKPRLPFIG